MPSVSWDLRGKAGRALEIDRVRKSLDLGRATGRPVDVAGRGLSRLRLGWSDLAGI